MPGAGGVAGFLAQLPLTGAVRQLTGHVPQPRRDLPEEMAHRVPVLADEQHLAGVVERDDGHGAGMLHDVPWCHIPIGHADLIGPQHHEGAPRPPRPALYRPVPPAVTEPRFGQFHGHALAAARCALAAGAVRTILECSRAAATSPVNSGCGRVGRERNSGCAWVATRYGWISRGNSTNSTKRPSGDSPEHCRPACSSTSR